MAGNGLTLNRLSRRQEVLARFREEGARGSSVVQVEHEQGQERDRLRRRRHESRHRNRQQDLPRRRDQPSSLGEVPSHRDTQGAGCRAFLLTKSLRSLANTCNLHPQTYNVNKQVPDSASTATALFGGVKTNYEVVGVDGNVPLGDCPASLDTDHHVDSIVSWAQAVGKDTGERCVYWLLPRARECWREY